MTKDKFQKAYESLTEKERCVFYYYLRKPGYTQEDVGKLCWPDGKHVTKNRVNQIVRAIRKKFEKVLLEIDGEEDKKKPKNEKKPRNSNRE